MSNYNETIVASFDARIAFEMCKKADNTSMQKTLLDLRKSVSHEKIAEIMSACDVDANFINREVRVDSRFNVYAAEKVVNIARFLASAARLNHYTLAIVKTAFALEKNDLSMTRDDAYSACSTLVKARDKSHEKHIVRYDRAVDASTASTQSSSSLNALLINHILIEKRDAANVAHYKLNRENTVTLDLLVSLDCETSEEIAE